MDMDMDIDIIPNIYIITKNVLKRIRTVKIQLTKYFKNENIDLFKFEILLIIK